MEKAIKKYFPIFLLPTMIAFAIGFIVPFVYGIFLSFCKFTTVTDWKWKGLQNYSRIFFVNGKLDTTFIHSLWYTALFTVVSVLIINVISFLIAMALTKGINDPGTDAANRRDRPQPCGRDIRKMSEA